MKKLDNIQPFEIIADSRNDVRDVAVDILDAITNIELNRKELNAMSLKAIMEEYRDLAVATDKDVYYAEGAILNEYLNSAINTFNVLLANELPEFCQLVWHDRDREVKVMPDVEDAATSCPCGDELPDTLQKDRDGCLSTLFLVIDERGNSTLYRYNALTQSWDEVWGVG